MIENTSADRVALAAEAIASFGDAFVIETREELVKVYREYVYRDMIARSGEARDDVDARRIDRVSNLAADLSTSQMEHNLDALMFILKRYRGQ